MINDLTFIDVTDETIVNERNREIELIHEDILDINEITKDMNEMLHQQGYIITKVEDKIHECGDKTVHAIEELKKADKYHQKYSYGKYKILGGLIIGTTIFGGIGAVFGIIPAVASAGLGGSLGAVIGFIK